MATSILRLGRVGSLKCLQQDGWGLLRTSFTAALCTKAEAPKKPAKKASSKTLEAPDERAALLANKTTVAFPTRLSTPGFLSQSEQSRECASAEPVLSKLQVTAEAADAKQVESVANDYPKAETQSCDVGEAAEAPPVVEEATVKNATSTTTADVEAWKSKVEPKDDDDATSSSSSSSDSDSDSDSDDEEPDQITMTRAVIKTDDKAGQKEIPSVVSEESVSDMKVRDVPAGALEGAPQGASRGAPEEPSKETVQEAAYVFKAPSKESAAPYPVTAPTEQILDPAPVLCTAESANTQAELKPEKEVGVKVMATDLADTIPEPITQGAPDIAVELTPELTLDPVTKVAPEPEVEIQAAPEMTRAVAASEELNDPVPVIIDAEEVRAESEVAAAPEEAAAAPAPEPEPQPFDNSTYQNLQHHTYNIYTFVDMDVEMAKHRLPQPSTGRPSPKH